MNNFPGGKELILVAFFLPKIKVSSLRNYTGSVQLYAHAFLRTHRYAPVSTGSTQEDLSPHVKNDDWGVMGLQKFKLFFNLFHLCWQLLLSADHFCKQFRTRIGLTKCLAWSGPKQFGTDGIIQKAIFCKS